MKKYFPVLITILLILNLYATSIDDNRLDKYIKALRSQHVDTIMVHKYALFNGSFHIRTNNKELFCEGAPYIYHFFWKKDGQLFCKRIDACGEFKDIAVQMKDFDTIVAALSTAAIEFKKQSAHFAIIDITILLSNLKNKISVSNAQLRSDKSHSIDRIEQLNKKIKEWEIEDKFKRV